MSDEDKPKVTEDHNPKNKPGKKKKDLIFIGDTYRDLYHTTKDGKPFTTNPLVETVDTLLDRYGDKFNIYVQSRYKLDQRTMPKAVAKAIVEVFVGDVPQALRAMHAKHPEMFDTCEIFMTVDSGVKEGGREWFEKFIVGIKLHAVIEEEKDKFVIPGMEEN